MRHQLRDPKTRLFGFCLGGAGVSVTRIKHGAMTLIDFGYVDAMYINPSLLIGGPVSIAKGTRTTVRGAKNQPLQVWLSQPINKLVG